MNKNQSISALFSFLSLWIIVSWMICVPFTELRAQMPSGNAMVPSGNAVVPSGSALTPSDIQKAKASWGFDFRNSMLIPGGIAMASSEAHHYLLSESEGLVVFRIQADSLQWLYTSSGMQARGNRLEADIRFAYLYGDTRRLTVLEPTSVLGVYSSTLLPSYPVAVTRIADKLYTATRDSGVVVIDLTTPESVDAEPTYLELGDEDTSILDIVSDYTSQLFVLTSPTRLQWFQLRDKSEDESGDKSGDKSPTGTVPVSDTPERVLEKAGDFLLSTPVERLFLTGNELFATSSDGQIFQVATGGFLNPVGSGSVGASVRQIRKWRNNKLIFTETGDLYLFSQDANTAATQTGSRENQQSGTLQWQFNTGGSGDHFLSVLENRVWIYQNEELTPLISPAYTESKSVSQGSENDQGLSGRLESLESAAKSLLVSQTDPITVPFATPVLLPVPIQVRGYNMADLSFEIESATAGAVIREGSFMWMPSASQTGTHLFKITITAPDGTRRFSQFEITVRPFNRPPQFVPLRALTLAADTFFETYLSAFDPDGSDRELVRYLGMDLPDGALLDEKTGRFTWTPTLRQTGSHSFRIIATDQYGAAAEASMSIQVIEIDESDEYRFDPPSNDSQNPDNPELDNPEPGW